MAKSDKMINMTHSLEFIYSSPVPIKMKNICIVGGGACGVAAFIELFIQITSQDLKEKVGITIIEKSKKVGYGLAFGTEEKGHLLNTQSELMGIYSREVSHFTEWLSNNADRARGKVEDNGEIETAYTSRIMYGDYLYEQFSYYLEKAKEIGVDAKLVCDEVNDINYENGNFLVSIKESDPIVSDYVILALGNPEATNFKEFEKFNQFLNTPWPSHKVKQLVEPGDHVGILGSSLSAIDTIMTLVDNGHKGKISCFSIEGLLPRVQPINNKEIDREILTLTNVHKIKREHFRAPKVTEIFRLFIQEVEKQFGKKLDWKKLDRMGGDAYTYLKEDIAAAEEGGDPLLNVAYSLRYDAATLWSWLSRDQKNFFKKWLGPQWTVNRHGMPLANAKKLVPLFESGVLHVFAEVGDIEHENGSFTISYGNGEIQNVDKLINATGSPSKLEAMDCNLTSNMIKKGLIKPYEGGGALINELTMEVLNPKSINGIYATGHMVNGMMLDVNAVWYNVRSIASLTKDIIFKVRYGEGS
ncbi:MAG TPA: FAD/NAD(P)-binding protein [Anditalea sp.]|nr:FAD/NAD(P)-binding protein [Anditalea sp.]